MRLSLSLLTLSMTALTAEYGFNYYHFIDPDRPWHVEGQYRIVGPADFDNHRRGHVNYSDADAGLYYTQFFNEENSLTYSLGYDFLRFDWKKNTRFSETNFNYLVGSLGYVSTTLDRWRWIINAGFSVDTYDFNFGKSAVGHAMLWGRYDFSGCNSNGGVHVGVFGWYGVLNGRAWPIFGFDWKFNDHWSSKAIFPWEYDLTYSFNENWALELGYSYFGGPYRYPRRAHSSDSIFTVYSNGAELTLKYQFEHLLRISVGGGWNFGGWIYIKNRNNHHGKYYHYESAPYAQGNLELTF